MNSSFWNDRYATEELVYGAAPNEFLASMADCLPSSGRAVDLGAGEGRNTLFLASRGLDALAVDQSDAGLRKAAKLAINRGLALRTQVADLQDFDLPPRSQHVVIAIFCHLPTTLRRTVYNRVKEWLLPGGLFLLESYAPDQLQRTTGGPKDLDRTPSLETMLDELDGLTIEHAAGLVRNVVEGTLHSGEAAVVQVAARKR